MRTHKIPTHIKKGERVVWGVGEVDKTFPSSCSLRGRLDHNPKKEIILIVWRPLFVGKRRGCFIRETARLYFSMARTKMLWVEIIIVLF